MIRPALATLVSVATSASVIAPVVASPDKIDVGVLFITEGRREGGGGSVDGGRVEVDGAVEMLLTGVTAFSSGFPLLSKNESASFATSAKDMLSTSFPIISLI